MEIILSIDSKCLDDFKKAIAPILEVFDAKIKKESIETDFDFLHSAFLIPPYYEEAPNDKDKYLHDINFKMIAGILGSNAGLAIAVESILKLNELANIKKLEEEELRSFAKELQIIEGLDNSFDCFGKVEPIYLEYEKEERKQNERNIRLRYKIKKTCKGYKSKIQNRNLIFKKYL